MNHLLNVFLGFSLILVNNLTDNRTNKTGDLVFTYEGVKKERPLFVLKNLAPGQCLEKKVQVRNKGKGLVVVAIAGTNFQGDQNLGHSLKLSVISTQNHYEGSLDQIVGQGGIDLFSLTPRKREDMHITVCFPTDSENTLQDKTLNFDLEFGYGGTK